MKKITRPYTKEELYNLYIVNNYSVVQISENYNCSKDMIYSDIHQYHFIKTKENITKSQQQTINIDYSSLYNYYITQNHTTNETAKHFNIHDRTLRRKLKQYNIYKSKELQQLASNRVMYERYGGSYQQCDYYRNNVLPGMLEKVKNTCLQKYGVSSYLQTSQFAHDSAKRYRFNDIQFDSSWELAMWIYAKDHNEDIVYHPCRFTYQTPDNINHYYFPDFLYKGQLIEIKGDHLLSSDGSLHSVYINSQWRDIYKQQCINNNNVVVWSSNDLKFVLDYINKVYGKDYLKSFKLK